jgi:hypothetical protein
LVVSVPYSTSKHMASCKYRNSLYSCVVSWSKLSPMILLPCISTYMYMYVHKHACELKALDVSIELGLVLIGVDYEHNIEGVEAMLRLIASHQVTENLNTRNVVYIYTHSPFCMFPSSTLYQFFELSAPTATMDEEPCQKELSTRPFTLVLVSHSHAPPLLPAPHLKFDLRKVSNPPKHARDTCDGRSKHLREHLLASEDFCALLETAQASIDGNMLAFAEKQSEDDGK